MLTPEERRQRILARGPDRLAKIRDANRGEKPDDMAPVSTVAPEDLLKKTDGEFLLPNRATHTDQSQSPSSPTSIFSNVSSAMNMFNSFSSLPGSSKKPIENTAEMKTLDKQHMFTCLLGILVRLLYGFYLSVQSNFFFIIFVTWTVALLTSRYYVTKMKLRTNALITTAMLSGFKPEIMQKIGLLYTLVLDSWVIFSFYFVAFCLTHVLFSLI